MPLTVISPERLFVRAPPNHKVVFPVEITNLANGPSVVRAQPGRTDLPVVAGLPLHLESRVVTVGDAHFRQETRVEVATPPATLYTNRIYSVPVTYQTVYDGDAKGTFGDEQTVLFAIQVQGVAAGGVAIAALLFAIVGMVPAVLLLRRRRPPTPP